MKKRGPEAPSRIWPAGLMEYKCERVKISIALEHSAISTHPSAQKNACFRRVRLSRWPYSLLIRDEQLAKLQQRLRVRSVKIIENLAVSNQHHHSAKHRKTICDPLPTWVWDWDCVTQGSRKGDPRVDLRKWLCLQ